MKDKEDEISRKLTTYLEYKNQHKGLKKFKSLIKNVSTFYYALRRKPLLILNFCLIPGVGEFLPIAASILGLQLCEITSIEQVR